jgi:DNA repair protein RadC
MQTGLSNFNECEMLELLLICIVPRKNAKTLAKNLLEHYGNLRKVFNASSASLRKVSGITSACAILLTFFREVARFYWRQEAFDAVARDQDFTQQLCNFWFAQLGNEHHESLQVACFDHEFSILPDGVECIHLGNFSGFSDLVRRVLEVTLRRRCNFIAICRRCHNGVEVLPSEHDERIFHMLNTSLKALSIQLGDYLVFNGVYAYSLMHQKKIHISMRGKSTTAIPANVYANDNSTTSIPSIVKKMKKGRKETKNHPTKLPPKGMTKLSSADGVPKKRGRPKKHLIFHQSP